MSKVNPRLRRPGERRPIKHAASASLLFVGLSLPLGAGQDAQAQTEVAKLAPSLDPAAWHLTRAYVEQAGGPYLGGVGACQPRLIDGR